MKVAAKMRVLLFLCICFLFSCFLIPGVSAEESTPAEDLTCRSLFTDYTGFPGVDFLFDHKLTWGVKVSAPADLTMRSDEGIGSLYIRFATLYGEYVITDPETDTSHVWQQQFLHDFIDLEELFGYVPKEITLTFDHDAVTINELYAYSSGHVPADVQRWEAPKDGATDLILFSTHGDDEHLFFAGILPYYAGELGYQVQLVYMTDHHNNDGVTRMREILDGLWTAGVTAYPVFGTYPDFYRWGMENAYIAFEKQGYSREDMIGFVVENIRRLKPKVVIGHDFAGEYSHGQHAVYADVLAEAVQISMDDGSYPESAANYGTWDVPKAYFHLYEENPIVMDWDIPLEAFDGLTAWQVSSRHALQKHVSQLEALEEDDVTWYFGNNPTAASVGRFSPCRFGLYRTTVGTDAEKNDFFENLSTHAEDAMSETLPPEEPTIPATEATEPPTEETTPVSEETVPPETASPDITEPESSTEPADTEVAPPMPKESPMQLWCLVAMAAILLVIAIILLRKCIRKK